MRQILRDHRTIALLILVPALALTLGAVLFRAEPATIPLGIVDEDEGIRGPAGRIVLGERIIEELSASDTFETQILHHDEIEERLRDGTVQGVVVLAEDFSNGLRQNGQVSIDLRLEGSNPTRSMQITARVSEAAIKALAGLASLGLGMPGIPQQGGAQLPIAIKASYLFAGEEFDTMDFVAPVYIALLGMFFVFLLTCVSFLRERSQGTMERLLATPATRLEIVLGYMLGLGLFALIQVALMLSFTIWVLKIHYLGSLALLFFVVAILAVVGVSMGILASSFARSEFQVVQFIPLFIIPQALLSGTFWAVEEMPGYLQPFAYAMPLTYANQTLRDVMLKGWGVAEIWPNLAILLGFTVVTIVLAAVTMRREVA
jgi:ABC-2 type transport system permease protein